MLELLPQLLQPDFALMPSLMQLDHLKLKLLQPGCLSLMLPQHACHQELLQAGSLKLEQPTRLKLKLDRLNLYLPQPASSTLKLPRPGCLIPSSSDVF